MSDVISFVQMQMRSLRRDEQEAVWDVAVLVFDSLGVILAVV